MATIRPFCALRPTPETVKAVASVPYDVVSVEEARALAEGNPLSFLHVVLPEIDLPPDTVENAQEVFQQGWTNLSDYRFSDNSVHDPVPALYIYRLASPDHAMRGVFGCVTVSEYEDGTIRRHEKTRPYKVGGRLQHIVRQRTHAEPVMLTYRNHAAVAEEVARAQQEDPLFDFEAEDGVRHTVWRLQRTEALVTAFAEVPHLYIADGHHRCSAAAQAYDIMKVRGSDMFPAVLFPAEEMVILPYNRVISFAGDAKEAIIRKTGVTLRPASTQTVPTRKGEVCVYVSGQWHTIQLPPTQRAGVASGLDVARLHEVVLEPAFRLLSPRSDSRIGYVGGNRSTDELEARVDRMEDGAAFSMYPTSMEELLEVSDAGELMPPKSTWFEPKLRSGLLVHMFDTIIE